MSGVQLELNKTLQPSQLQPIEEVRLEKEPEITISEQKPDTFEKSVKDECINKEPKTLREKFANVCKTFVKTGDYLKATGATVIYGGLTAGAVMFSNWLVKGWPKVLKKQIPLNDMFNKPLKCVSRAAKFWAGAAFAAVGGYQFAKAYLKANQHAAHVDQKLNNR